MTQPNPSPTEALRVATASIIFAVTAQIILGLGLLIFTVAYRQKSLHENDLWTVLMLSCFPYAILGLQTMWRAITGVDGVFPHQLPQNPTQATVKNFIATSINKSAQEIHLVPINNVPEPKINGVPLYDFLEFIDEIPNKGIKTRDWVGDKRQGKEPHTFKSRRKCRYHTWKAIIDTLCTAEIIVDMEQGRTGELTLTSPALIKQVLRIHKIIPEEYL